MNGVRNGQTKNGKPFAVVSIEDYNGSTELFLLGEKCMNFAAYLRPGEFLYIKGNVGLNWRKKKEIQENPNINPTPEDWELQVATISLLSEVREKLGKSIYVKLDAKVVDQELIEELTKLAKAHKGNTTLKIELFDRNENLSVKLMSRSVKVETTNELIRGLKQLTEDTQLMTA